MGRRPCCSKEGLNRGAWSAREDRVLASYIAAHGEGKWRDLPRRAGLKRCGKSCRLRWLNYLRPDIKRGNITTEEEELIIRLHRLLGNRWSLIAGRLPGRTDNEIKNYWNTNLSKRLLQRQKSDSPPATTTTQRRTIKKHKEIRRPHLKEYYYSPTDRDPPPPAVLVRTKAVRCTGVYLPQRRDTKGDDDNGAFRTDDRQSPSSPPPPPVDSDDPFDLFCCGLNMEKIITEIQESDLLLQDYCDVGGRSAQVSCDDAGVGGLLRPTNTDVVVPQPDDVTFDEKMLEEWGSFLEQDDVDGDLLASYLNATGEHDMISRQ